MDAAETYKTESITTQQRGRLIVMLYEGAVKFLNVAKEKLSEGDYALKGVYIGKAQDVISELNGCLNVEAAPEMASDLRALYNFIYRQLNEANIERSAEKIDDCIEILEELGEAWQQVAESPQVAALDEAQEAEFKA
jgi:flagellar protein FliS